MSEAIVPLFAAFGGSTALGACYVYDRVFGDRLPFAGLLLASFLTLVAAVVALQLVLVGFGVLEVTG